MKAEIKRKKKTVQPAAVRVQRVVIDKENNTYFISITLLAYLVIGLIGVFHHEMWRDELQTWVVGVSSSNIASFFHNMKTQYDPYGWNIIEYILSRFTNSPVIDQIFHFLVTTGSVYLLLRYAPFSRLQKVLLTFSYYILFEYSIIARGYALTVFFVFLFCSFYNIKSKNRYIILSLILFCLPNGTGAHGMILEGSLLGMMLIDYYLTKDISTRRNYKPFQLYLSTFIALIGIYIAFKCMSPPSSATDRSNTWMLNFDLQRMIYTLRTFWMSFIPIPSMSTVNFWNSNLLFNQYSGSFIYIILFFVSLSIFIFCFLYYSNKLSVLVFYLVATCGVLLLSYTNNVVFVLKAARHYGFLFIAFIAASWLNSELTETKFIIPGVGYLRDKFKIGINFTYLLTALLLLNMIGGIIAYYKDNSLVFSNIERTGKYIVNHHLDKLPEIGFIDYAVSPISAYTNQIIYFPDRDTTCRFTTWSNARFSFDINVILSRSIGFVSRQHDSVLYISTGDYFGIGQSKVLGDIEFTKIASFNDAVVPDENYDLYIARKFDLSKLMNDSNAYRSPGKVASILSSGYDLLQKGKLDEAGNIFTTVAEKTHGMAIPHLHNYLGMLYTKKNMTNEAEKEFNTEISMNLQKEEAFFNLGMLYFQEKAFEKAIMAWDSTISINPKDIDAYNNLGISYLNFKGDNSRAKYYFEEALKLNPNYIQEYYNLMVCAQNSHDEESLVKYLRILHDKGVSLNDIRAKGINISDELMQKINAR